MAEMTSNWTQAIAEAEKHPEGRLVNVYPVTLKSMVTANACYKATDGQYYLIDMGPGRSVPVESEVEKSVTPQRQRFYQSLDTLLIAENLAGTEWAIQQIREEGLRRFGPNAIKMADMLEVLLDKRTAELTIKEN
jgi:hypothetical protein